MGKNNSAKKSSQASGLEIRTGSYNAIKTSLVSFQP